MPFSRMVIIKRDQYDTYILKRMIKQIVIECLANDLLSQVESNDLN